jgi:protein-tyrosine kinase
MSRIDQAFARAGAAGTENLPHPQADAGGDVPIPWDVENVEEPESPQSTVSAEPAAPVALRPLSGVEASVGATGTPVVQETRFVSRLNPEMLEKLVVTRLVDSRCIEQYRRSAALLHLAQAERGIKIVMVASAELGEGKTLTAANIALTLSESYRRSVLLVDADLRKPAVHNLFQIPNISGLTDGLKSVKERKIGLVQYSDYLSILPAGKPDSDPMSALTSDRMQRVLSEATSTFDWVVIDTPPIGLLPDAHLLASMADAVILVVRAATTPCAAVKHAITAIGADRILGVVLNRVEYAKSKSEHEYDGYVQRSSDSSDCAPRLTSPL